MKEQSKSRQCAQEAQQCLERAAADLRKGVGNADEPQLKAILEASAEVLTGLARTFADYRKNEPARQ